MSGRKLEPEFGEGIKATPILHFETEMNTVGTILENPNTNFGEISQTQHQFFFLSFNFKE